ncbi:TonB-dependent receptor [Caulobacter sp. 17J65-9]|uniref:TonB-dependent receptor n=1 Tax=Caulobacter sp. 17J65-9 TaxID=2709382 RepID=UPI0013CD38D1|nr:TonB-dependent receptor [Caulobacter sp. 17J65-9]NEX92468.1 TonB-dependent receptor [Caulobacter sp. 17J65-9]
MRSKLIYGAAAAALAMAAASAAAAQSTGSQEVEEVVVTAQRGQKTLDGVIAAEKAAKSRATVTQEYLSTQQPGQTVLQSLNLMPGVTFTNNDAYGAAGGDLVIRGYDAQRISMNVDGIQLNDTGNYQIYSNQQVDPELIERASVNLGTTDVDSPTASATGGTVNYITRKPAKEFGGFVQLSAGEDNYRRGIIVVDTGEIGPFGASAWFSASKTEYDKFVGPGGLEKTQYNGRVYQPLGDNGDFVSLSGHWNENRNNFIRRVRVAQFNNGVVDPDNDPTCTLLTPVNGTAQNESSVCSNYYNLSINPSDTGNIRGQSRFTLGEGLVLTVDPTFQYVLANGGGSTALKETDARLQGSFFNAAAPTATGVDLNGDGDLLDTIRLYSPSNTNTRRYSVNTSLIWDFAEDQRLRFAYTFDRGNHRQTGEFSYLDAKGNPTDPFSAKDGHDARPVLTLDGDVLQKRNRTSIATLNQFAVEYVGNFMDDSLTLNLGVRAPFFKRELNNRCYQEDTFNAFCGNLSQAEVNSVKAPVIPGAPAKFTREYEDILPNVGLTWRFADNQSVYASYSENLSAPRTDDLYDRIPANPDPETSRQYDVGYRFQSGRVMLSTSAFFSEFDNYIVRALNTLDGGETITTNVNIGSISRWGADGQLGFEPVDGLTFYASASLLRSEIQDNVPGNVTKGREVPETPHVQFGTRVQYETGDFVFGVQSKSVSERWTNVTNTEKTQGYTVFDADIRYNLDSLGYEGAYLQLNAQNLFDRLYIGDISTDLNGARQGQLGAPRTVSLTLRAPF